MQINKENLIEKLKQKGWTIKVLSDKTGIAYDRVSHLINGYRVLSPEEAEAMAIVLDTDKAEFVDGLLKEETP